MSLQERIIHHYTANAELNQETLMRLGDLVEAASVRLAHCLLSDSKILVCGNGGSAAQAQHFSSELINRYERDRPGLPAISLTTDTCALTSIANDYRFDEVFAKQVRALGHPEDILVVYTTSGNSASILSAVTAAHDRDMSVIALTGRDGGTLAPLLRETDLELRVPAEVTARIQEAHLLMTHCFCDLIDQQLFGE